jgi:hypothetical protein
MKSGDAMSHGQSIPLSAITIEAARPGPLAKPANTMTARLVVEWSEYRGAVKADINRGPSLLGVSSDTAVGSTDVPTLLPPFAPEADEWRSLREARPA